MTLEAIWEMREENIYPRLFGHKSRGIFPLEHETFHRFGVVQIDPIWLHHGIIEFNPTEDRPSWLYVTSGHSNPYDDNSDFCDESVEFALAVTEPGDWAIRCLQSIMAFDKLLRVNHFPGKPPLDLYDRIPLHEPLNGDEKCILRRLMVTETAAYPGFDTPAGHVAIRSLTAITDTEWFFAKDGEKEAGVLVERLERSGHHPINDPWRASLL